MITPRQISHLAILAVLALTAGPVMADPQKAAPKMDIGDLIRPSTAPFAAGGDGVTAPTDAPASDRPTALTAPAQAQTPAAAELPPPAAEPVAAPPTAKKPVKTARKQAQPEAVTEQQEVDAVVGPGVNAGDVAHPQSTAAVQGTPEEEAVAPAVPIRPKITVIPGINEIIPIAVNHPNRIETPFKHADVMTLTPTEDAKFTTKGSVIYVSTDKLAPTKAHPERAPITAFVTEKGTQGPAMSITLIAYQLPPQSVSLSFPDDVAIPFPKTETPDQTSQEASSRTEEITDAFRAIALGEIPQGYTFRQTSGADQLPGCGLPPGVSLSYSPGQVFVGASSDIYVGVVTNGGPKPIELKEKWCVTDRVGAVAFWPDLDLGPNQQTEVYIMRVPARRNGLSQRPSLLGGQTR